MRWVQTEPWLGRLPRSRKAENYAYTATVFILSSLAIVLFGGLYLLTKNRRYLNLAGQIARFVLFAILIFAVLFVLERYALIGWRTLM